MKNKPMEKAIQTITDIFKFEHWIRFYFIKETDDGLMLDIPDTAMDKIKESHENYLKLVEDLTGKPLSPEVSQQSIVRFIAEEVENKPFKPDLVHKVLSSRQFASEVHTFNLWVEVNEDHLDKTFMDFATWINAFNEWKSTDKAKDLILKLTASDGSSKSHAVH